MANRPAPLNSPVDVAGQKLTVAWIRWYQWLSNFQIVIFGTSTNDDAPAGGIGEYITSSIASGSAVSLASGTPSNVTSINLTSGDWDISGFVKFVPSGTTSITEIGGCSDTSSGTFDSSQSFVQRMAATVVGAVSDIGYAIPVRRVKVPVGASQAAYLVATATFSVSTLGAYGTISARRVR